MTVVSTGYSTPEMVVSSLTTVIVVSTMACDFFGFKMETHPNVVSSVIDEPSYKVRYTQKSEIRPGGYRIISPIDSKEFYKPDEIITFIIGENLLNH